jgi:NADH-quinone oxidoreductase subunit A
MKITIIIIGIVLILFIVSYNYSSGFIIKERRYDSPKIEKYSKYECGEEPIEELNKVEELYIKYYMIALTYLLFDIEIILLFPYISYLLSVNHLLFYSFSFIWSTFILIFFFFVLLGLFLEYVYGLFN